MPAEKSPGGAPARNGFDKLSRLYRPMEYLSFGPLLWRTRVTFLPKMDRALQALVLGDGDGRFTAALLALNPSVRVHAVDASGTMLDHLHERAVRQGDASRVTTLHADATLALPNGWYDLVCTHFFLDCLSDAQCRVLASGVAQRMQAGGRWVISEFAVPQNGLRWLARGLVRTLYAAFGLLTGLRVTRLPNHNAALQAAGFRCTESRSRLGGILRAEMWLLDAREQTEVRPATSNQL